jgi:hypothetical protein
VSSWTILRCRGMWTRMGISILRGRSILRTLRIRRGIRVIRIAGHSRLRILRVLRIRRLGILMYGALVLLTKTVVVVCLLVIVHLRSLRVWMSSGVKHGVPVWVGDWRLLRWRGWVGCGGGG